MLYHITTEALWEKALNTGKYYHPSLDSEGYIHLSQKDELLPTVEKFFADAEELFILHIADKQLQHELLKYEPVPGRDSPMPHYYARVPLKAVHDMSIEKRGEGGWDFSGLV
ncbi:MAG: DUF952 domain-containing protein [Bacteroidota bacterium]